jgi:hypothetical protein
MAKPQPTNKKPTAPTKPRPAPKGDGLLDQFDDDILRQSWQAYAEQKEQKTDGHKNVQPESK